jgi:hypothetical protein
MRKTALMILSKTQTDIEYIIDLKFCSLQNNELLCIHDYKYWFEVSHTIELQNSIKESFKLQILIFFS